MDDITIIFLTVNKVPKGWAEYQKSVLLEAVGDTPIITISKEPMDWGLNLIQEGEPSVLNIYKQVLRGAKKASTPYIGIAEDDHLYQEEHFRYRPKGDNFAYDMTRWGIHTWGKPAFYYKNRISNGAMIAPRKLAIEALEERFERYPTDNRIGELGKEKGRRLSYRDRMETFWSLASLVYFSHENAIDPLEQKKKKRMGMVRAYEIPHWGRAEDLVKKWK